MYTWRELVALYRLTDPAPPSNLQPRYNICPTTTINAVIERDYVSLNAAMSWEDHAEVLAKIYRAMAM